DRLRETDRDKQEDRVTTSPWLQPAAGLLGRIRFITPTIGGLTLIDVSSKKTSASISKHPVEPNQLTTVQHCLSAPDIDASLAADEAVRVSVFMHQTKCGH
ncbi:hypothetical protein ABVT39_014866, partial [Epinephelus coioides]